MTGIAEIATERENKEIHQPNADEVRSLVTTGAKWSILSLLVRQFFGMASTFLLSRLIAPGDFGLSTMAVTITSFLVLYNQGLAWATVQRKRITEHDMSTMFWIGVGIGLVLWAATVAGAPWIAKFYNSPKLLLVCRICATMVLLDSMSTQLVALIQRKLQQKTLSLIETSALIISSMVAIVLAWAFHLGYWALVTQMLLCPLIRLVMLFRYSRMRPTKFVYSTTVTELLHSGTFMAAANFVGYFQLFLAQILIGKFCGEVQLGYFAKANFLKQLPTQYAALALSTVMVPAIAALASDPIQMGGAYRKAMAVTAFIACPMGALLAPMATETVRILYGPQWGESVWIVKMLAIVAITLPICTSFVWLFFGASKGRELLYLQLVMTPFMVASYLFAAMKFGVVGIVSAEVIAFALVIPTVQLIYTHRITNLSLADTMHIITPILLCSLVAGASLFGLDILLRSHHLHYVITFVIKGVTGTVIYLWLAFKFVRPFPVPQLQQMLDRFTTARTLAAVKGTA